MILDSSAVVSIFLRRAGWERLIDALAGDQPVGIGAPTLSEAGGDLLAATGRDLRSLLARFVTELDLIVIPFGEAHARAAGDAFLRYGSGRGRAGLDLGDCLAYATARLARQPLLTDDARFAKTDLELIRPRG